MSAKPADGAAYAALRQEAAAKGDVAVLPHVWEGYANITHQTLEVLRAAALDPVVTHALKVRKSMLRAQHDYYPKKAFCW